MHRIGYRQVKQTKGICLECSRIMSIECVLAAGIFMGLVLDYGSFEVVGSSNSPQWLYGFVAFLCPIHRRKTIKQRAYLADTQAT